MTVQRQEIIDVLRPFAEEASDIGDDDVNQPLAYRSISLSVGHLMDARSLLQRLEAEGEAPSIGSERLSAQRAWFTHEDAGVAGHLYYFAPAARSAPPYLNQRHVEAIIDIASDGTLAGVELIDNMPPLLNQEGGDPEVADQSTEQHVALPASGSSGSGRGQIAEQIAKGHIDTGFGEAMDELMAGELADKIEKALASEYERGVAAGIREGLERAAKVADESAEEAERARSAIEMGGDAQETERMRISRTSWLNTSRATARVIRSLINEAKPEIDPNAWAFKNGLEST